MGRDPNSFFEGGTKRANAGAGVEHDNLTVGSEFDAGGIAAVAQSADSRDRDGDPRTPQNFRRSRC